MKNPVSRQSYLTKNVGEYSDVFEMNGVIYKKVEDLRYGTNPHQTAAYYKPESSVCPIGDMKILKTGKSGLSQTNLEDISYALNIVKFFGRPACAVMKHVNPSGAAVATGDETAKDVYIKARDCDPRAAFGSTIAFNCAIDKAVAEEIMRTFVECVVAPEILPDALEVFNDGDRFKLNRHIRILQCGDIRILPRFSGEALPVHNTIKVLADGSIVVAEPLLTKIRSANDFHQAEAESQAAGKQKSKIIPAASQKQDMLFAWYVNINVRSNGVVIAKSGQTLSVGTGEQDRVGAVEQAISKYCNKYEGQESMRDAVMASDGFFPFPDAIEIAAGAGITAVIAPAGSLKDAEVIKRADELGVALVHAPERIFSHH